MQLNTFLFFFFNDTATTEIYTLSLHDALPISQRSKPPNELVIESFVLRNIRPRVRILKLSRNWIERSEEHTSELQSRPHLVCRLLLENKKYFTLNSDAECLEWLGMLPPSYLPF